MKMQLKFKKKMKRVKEKAWKKIQRFMEQLLVVKKDLDELNLLTAIINLRFVLNKSSRDKSGSKSGSKVKDLILVN